GDETRSVHTQAWVKGPDSGPSRPAQEHTMDALRLDVDGNLTEVTFGDSSLKALQEGVGGIVDCVSLSDTIDMWVHDEGMFMFAVNPFASAIAPVIRGQRLQDFHGAVVFT